MVLLKLILCEFCIFGGLEFKASVFWSSKLATAPKRTRASTSRNPDPTPEFIVTDMGVELRSVLEQQRWAILTAPHRKVLGTKFLHTDTLHELGMFTVIHKMFLSVGLSDLLLKCCYLSSVGFGVSYYMSIWDG